MEDFVDASSYCQHLKSLANQQPNIGATATNDQLVHPLVAGLTIAYSTVGTEIFNGNTLPPFYKA